MSLSSLYMLIKVYVIFILFYSFQVVNATKGVSRYLEPSQKM